MKFIGFGLITCAACAAVSMQTTTYTTEIYSVARNSDYARARRAVAREDRIARERTNSHRRIESKKDRRAALRKIEARGSSQKKLGGTEGGVENYQWSFQASGDGREDEERERYGTGVPAWDWNELLYITDVQVGSSKQKFRTLLSISDSDMFIPSTSCTKTCTPSHHLYDASLSSTHVSSSTVFERDYASCSVSGNLTTDTITLAGVSIPNQQFGSVASISRFTDPDWGNLEWDGLLGLARSSTNSSNATGNPFSNMIKRNLIPSPVFTLRLPRGDAESGVLTFGSVDHSLYEGTLKTIPLLKPSSSNPKSNHYRIPLTFFSLSRSKTHSPLPSSAILSSTFPGISLPSSLLFSLHAYLNMTRLSASVPPSIPCSQRSALPSITLNLGDHAFELSPWEYTLEVEREDLGGRRCVSLFMENEYADGGEGEDVMVLGSGFLRNWITVVDAGEGVVRFGKVKSAGA
ncbi:vacuolar protease A protein [Rutstroemia sp. NJR-2017a BVV2]|nr:vacuolar protease A protein [Rutstroemia sp. NJR-2017a BVV2]PQE21859.1 vacuolar protease A protein [Rutstroemia sp. NJR-2017a BVV2]